MREKIAVVTGASRGIGRAIALRLAKEGAFVILNFNGSEERAREAVAEIEAAGGKAEAIRCDVSDFRGAEAFFVEIIKNHQRRPSHENERGGFRQGDSY